MKLRELLSLLAEGVIRFSIVGGVALIARGVQRATEDLDIAYARDRENLARLAKSLATIPTLVVKPAPEKKGTTLTFYFDPSAKTVVGDHLVIETRTQAMIAQGWTSAMYGATFKKIAKK